jgi:hypothetical protein
MPDDPTRPDFRPGDRVRLTRDLAVGRSDQSGVVVTVGDELIDVLLNNGRVVGFKPIELQPDPAPTKGASGQRSAIIGPACFNRRPRWRRR